MGTNYYARKVCGADACAHCKVAEQHIGKTSAGWVFAARWMDELEAEIAPVRNDVELRSLIFGESVRVFDEYGDEHQPGDLWDNIIRRSGQRRSTSAMYGRELRVEQSDIADYCAYEFS